MFPEQKKNITHILTHTKDNLNLLSKRRFMIISGFIIKQHIIKRLSLNYVLQK